MPFLVKIKDEEQKVSPFGEATELVIYIFQYNSPEIKVHMTRHVAQTGPGGLSKFQKYLSGDVPYQNVKK